MGLAFLSTVLTHQTAAHLTELSSAMSIANPASQEMLDGLGQMMAANGSADPDGAAHKAMWFLMRRQAATQAFGDAFLFLSLTCWAAVGLAFFATSRPATFSEQPQGAH
jgi:DHA2 family multidrug resistance protein